MLAIGTLIACSQKHTKPSPANSEIQSQAKVNDNMFNTSNAIKVGYQDEYNKLPTITLDSISESEFVAAYQPQVIDSVIRDSDKEHFYITTVLGRQAFLKYDDRNNGKSWFGYEYVGYYQAINLYAVTNNVTSQDLLGFGSMELINANTGITYELISLVGDSAVDTPVLSPDKNYFLYFQNSDFETTNSEICILKIDNAGSPEKYLQPVVSHRSDHFLVDKICWGKNRDIYIKGYSQAYNNESEQWIRTYKFFHGHW